MKKLLIFFAGLPLAGLGCGPYQITTTAPAAPIQPITTETAATSPSPAQTPATTGSASSSGTVVFEQPPSPAPITAPVAAPANGRIKIFFVAMDDNGKSGTMIGCGDSIVGVEQIIDPPGTDPLVAALTALFKEKNNYYGESGLYNSLSESNLQIKKISAVNGVYTIELAGTMSLGGSCDDPRFYSQIMETIQQFPTVKKAEVFINNKKLEDVVSEKG